MARFGIDLGTTYSEIARYDPDRALAQVAQLSTSDGDELLRSVVYYPPGGGDPVVGETAMNVFAQHPDRVIIGVKWSMGSSWTTPPFDGRRYTAAEVSAQILRVLKRDGEACFGDPVNDVIITVPAYFGPNQRRDTEEAGKMAGLNVIRLLEEPSAAALAYAIDKIDQIAGRNILVYDLGGGTFDVTLIRCEREEYAPGKVGLKIHNIYKSGDNHLGGLLWDSKLQEFVAERCQEQFQYNPKLDHADNATLIEQCEKRKRALSTLEEVTISADMRGHTVQVTRTEFEDRAAVHLELTRVKLEEVLQMAENPPEALKQQFKDILPLSRDKIEVLLCGGATKMPAVVRLVTEMMGRPPLKHDNPELLVVKGAAYAAYLSPQMGEDKTSIRTYGEGGPQDIIMDQKKDIIYVLRPIGVKVLKDPDHPELGSRNDVVIPGDATVGAIHEGHYAAAYDGVMKVSIELLEGDDPDPAKCTALDTFVMETDIPGRPKGWAIAVRLNYDDSGNIVGEATDVEMKTKMKISYQRQGR